MAKSVAPRLDRQTVRILELLNIITLGVGRIRALELTPEAFTVDPGSDPKRYEAEAFGVARATSKPVLRVRR